MEEVAAAVKIELALLHEDDLDRYGLAVDFNRFIALTSNNATGVCEQ